MSDIFDITLDTADFSEFTGTSTDGGNLSVTTAAALVGSYGISALINDGNQLRAYKDITKVTTYVLRAYVDPNTLTMADNDQFTIFRQNQNGGAGRNIVEIVLKYTTAAGYQLVIFSWNEAGTAVVVDSCVISDAPHYVEYKIVQAATSSSADGTFQWKVDGVDQGTVTAIDNYNLMFDVNWRNQWGMIANRDAGTSGTFYLDAFRANNDGAWIGAASTASNITGAGNIASAGALGSPLVGVSISAVGIASAGALGSPLVGVSISAASIASAGVLGSPTVSGDTAPVISSGVGSLFGERKFGTFRFGPTVQTRPRFGLEVDWDNSSLFTGENEGRYLQDLSIERGRKYTISADGQSFQVEDTGRFSATLLDVERRFDPYNTASPLFGKLSGGKYFRVRVRTPNDAYYPLMAGTIDEPVNFSDNAVDKAKLEGTDGWSFLRNQKNEVTVPLQENIYADQAIEKVLDAAGWAPIWGSDLGTGVDQRPYFWVDGRSAAQVIHELAHNELGNVCIAANGNLKFRSRLSSEYESITLTDADIRVNGFRRMSPAEVIRNVIKVASTPRSEETVQMVWEIPGRLEIAAGETIDNVFAEFKYSNETVPVKNPITPVASTDYDGKQNEDGSGSDYTSSISVSMYSYSTRAQLSITNNGVSRAWVYVRVRGMPISKASTVSFGYRDEASIKQFGPRPFTLTVDQSVNIARQYRDILSLYLTQSKNFLVVDLVPNPEIQFGIDLGQILNGRFVDYGIDQAYRVIRVVHKFIDKAGMATNTRLWLEPYIRLFTGVQIPMQIPFQLGSVL